MFEVIKINNMPTKPGFYWAKNSGVLNPPWIFVVHLYETETGGLSLDIWNPFGRDLVIDCEPQFWNQLIFGPRIPEPEES